MQTRSEHNNGSETMRHDHCPHCRDLAECREVAEKRRAQRDFAQDQVKAMAVEIDALKREIRRLRDDRHGCRHHDHHGCCEHFAHTHHHEHQCGGRR